MYKPHHQSMNCTFLAFFSRPQGDCCVVSVLMVNISGFWMLNQTQRHLEPRSRNSPLNHYRVAGDSTHNTALEELHSLGRSGVQLITYHCKNRAHRSEADLPQNTPGQSTPLTQQLCFLPLKWRSLISLFPGFLLPTSSASARLSNRLRASLHTENTQVRPKPRP